MSVQFQKYAFIGWIHVALSDNREHNIFEEIRYYIICVVEPVIAIRQIPKGPDRYVVVIINY